MKNNVAAAELFTRAHTQQDETRIFIAVGLRRPSSDPKGLEDVSFDINVTDFRGKAWRGHGITRQDFDVDITDHLHHFLTALVGIQPSLEPYSCRFIPQQHSNKLLVEVLWDQNRHGKDVTYRLLLTLEAADTPALAAVGMLGSMAAMCKAAEIKATRLLEECEQIEKAIARNDATLDARAVKKTERDLDVAVKFGALMESKGAKLEELQADLGSVMMKVD